MSLLSKEYEEKVLDDLKNYVGLNHPIKASVLERILIKKMSPLKMHPNPEDEFSMPAIGPNFEIVSDYCEKYRDTRYVAKAIKEPLIVEKMSTGGYMLLNGHHRWLAASRVGIRKLPVRIVNVTPEEDIYKAVHKSDRRMCISFDLDEVLLTDGEMIPKEKRLIYPFNKLYRRSLRKNAASLISDLRKMGFDVWVYTGDYFSKEYIEMLFALHNVKIDGVVNGLSKKSNRGIKNLFVEKYELSVHVDNESVLFVNTKSSEYESVEIVQDAISWAAKVMSTIKSEDIVNQLVKGE